MEPASIASTALNAAKVLAQVGVIVYEFHENRKAVPAEIAALSSELSALQVILDQIKESEAANVDVSNCNDALQAVGEKLATVDRKVQKGGFDRFFVTLTAAETRGEIKDLLSNLERSKTLLLLSMQVMNMRGWQAALDAASNAHSGGMTGPEPSMGAVDAENSYWERANRDDRVVSKGSRAVAAGESAIDVHPSVAGWLSSFRDRS